MNPYSDLPASAFWRDGVANPSALSPENFYTRRWRIPKSARFATAGSCFAQHLARHLKANGLTVIDAEPAPVALTDAQHHAFGFSMYSARYGNIYTAAQLLQLVTEVMDTPREDIVWEKGGRYVDALRPAVEPEGHARPEDVHAHRAYHLERVREVFLTADVFVFTLGLTEAWTARDTGTVFPTAPGTVAGQFDPERFAFVNYNVGEVVAQMLEVQSRLKTLREGRGLRFLLTVSPVPLTATASGQHALVATTYSKAVLRAAAGELVTKRKNMDYFPSYEIITNPGARGMFFEPNLRSVRMEGVETVMRAFFGAHGNLKRDEAKSDTADEPEMTQEDVQCEEAILEVFGQ